MTADERADMLAAVAVELVGRVRDDDPVDVHRWLLNAMRDSGDWVGLAVVLACAVPDDRKWSQLTEWTWLRNYGDGRPDTDDKVLQRQRDLREALDPPRWKAA